MGNIPRVQCSNLVDLVIQRGSDFPDKPVFEFLLDGENQIQTMTYNDLLLQSQAIAVTLADLGAVGQRVLLLYPPCLDYITAFLGCQFAGAIAVPMYPPDVSRLEKSLLRFLAIAANAQASVVLTTSSILGMAQFLITQYPELGQIHWLATDPIIADHSLSGRWHRPDIREDSLAFLQYTSGSTSDPKGVMLTHSNLIYQLEMIIHAFDLKDGLDQAVFWLPFYHDMGLIGGILGTIYSGGTTTLLSPLDFLQRPIRWLQAISRVKATISGGPNFAFDLCVRKVTPAQKEMLDLSSWELAFNGAEPLRAETMKRFAKVFEPCGFRNKSFYPCYGLAEATLLVTGVERSAGPTYINVRSSALANHQVAISESEEEGTNQLVGCGKPWLDQKVVIINTDDMIPHSENKEGISDVGEIWVSGESIAQGYWQRSEETERTFNARLPGYESRFLRTGDLGFTKDGELFVTGRIKDMIIIDGLNHYPQDIEATLEKSHPAIRPGCSAAFSVEINGNELLVVVAEVIRNSQLQELSVKEGIDCSKEGIETSIRRAISSEHDLHLHQVTLLKPGSIPKTSSGKIQRRMCKAGFLNNTLDFWQP